jgi:hypothetical protein
MRAKEQSDGSWEDHLEDAVGSLQAALLGVQAAAKAAAEAAADNEAAKTLDGARQLAEQALANASKPPEEVRQGPNQPTSSGVAVATTRQAAGPAQPLDALTTVVEALKTLAPKVKPRDDETDLLQKKADWLKLLAAEVEDVASRASDVSLWP